ncbi:MAG: dihydroorotate dehydrogenase electron transfer subunit [Clostridiales bacterium]|nr:dihydroorotate dehydrogenase electron transfer subunit [Clostridiales bacterium]
MRSGVVLANESIGGGYHHMIVNCPKIAEEIKDGQIVHIRVKDGYEPLLRRPFSVYLYDSKAGTIEFVYAIKGVGTEMMMSFKPGDEIDLLGPTGKSYTLKEGAKKIVLLGRGVGIASIISLGVSAADKAIQVEAILSGKSPEKVFGGKALQSPTTKVNEVYDIDGTSDVENVLKILKRTQEEGAIDQIFVCGSKRLGQLAYDFSNEHNIEGYVSLEERMACGIGVCHVCVCKTTKGYQTVCKDGPVFPLAEVYG